MKLQRLIQIETRRQTAYERLFAREILKAFKKNAESWIKYQFVDNSVGVALERLYYKTMVDYLSRQWEQFDKNIAQKKERFFMPTWSFWIENYILNTLINKVVGIDETTRDKLIEETIESNKIGETREEFSKRIQLVMGGAAGKKRAKVIARTEAGNAINIAKTKSAEDWAAQTDLPIGKLWIHRGAKDPRDWHIALDTGIEIPKDEPFIVTDPNTGITDRMMYPHDPSASAGNVINCGCQVVYVRLKQR
jgi:hypothetical protein